MFQWKRSLLLLTLTAIALGQMATKRSEAVTRVGLHLACQCGHCADTVAGCKMQLCGSSAPARERIAKMQAEGQSDQAIIDTFLKEWGKPAYRENPSSWSWITPYVALAFGFYVIYWFVRRAMRPRKAPAGDAQLAQYNEQIEKELANLD